MLNSDIADTKEKVNDDNYNDHQDMEKELDNNNNNNNAEDSLAKNNISNTKENRISRNKNKEINDSKKDLVVHDKEVLQLAHEMINNVAERLAEFGKEEEEPRRITEISLSSIFRPSKTPENKERKQVEIEKNSNDSAAAILPMEIGISESDAVIDVIEEEEEIDDDSGLRLSFERRKHLEAKRKKKSKLSTEFDKVDKEKTENIYEGKTKEPFYNKKYQKLKKSSRRIDLTMIPEDSISEENTKMLDEDGSNILETEFRSPLEKTITNIERTTKSLPFEHLSKEKSFSNLPSDRGESTASDEELLKKKNQAQFLDNDQQEHRPMSKIEQLYLQKQPTGDFPQPKSQEPFLKKHQQQQQQQNRHLLGKLFATAKPDINHKINNPERTNSNNNKQQQKGASSSSSDNTSNKSKP